MPNKLYKIHPLSPNNADGFDLTALELDKFIDFEVKRIYFIRSKADMSNTGSHCHLEKEMELFVPVTGNCKMQLDDGSGLESIDLEALTSAVYVPVKVWHQFTDMSDDLIICAISSTNYDPSRSDYCENYEEFKQLFVK